MTRLAARAEFPRVVRGLPAGLHPYVDLMPGIEGVPALWRIFSGDEALKARVLGGARVHVREEKSYAFIDVSVPCIVLSEWYYREGDDLDLYLDLLHELTHLRQLAQGRELWDRRFAYVDRETEIEGYAVAVEEGRRLGMSEAEIVQHLSNPWMTPEDVQRLRSHVDAFLAARPRT